MYKKKEIIMAHMTNKLRNQKARTNLGRSKAYTSPKAGTRTHDSYKSKAIRDARKPIKVYMFA